MEGGCKTFPAIKALEGRATRDSFKTICQTIREDGAYVEAGENDNLIVQKLVANPNALGVFGYSFLDQNADKIQGSTIDGVAPTFENIADGKYPISRPALLLREEGARRRDPRHPGVRRRVHQREGDRRGRLSRRQGPDPAAATPSASRWREAALRPWHRRALKRATPLRLARLHGRPDWAVTMKLACSLYAARAIAARLHGAASIVRPRPRARRGRRAASATCTRCPATTAPTSRCGARCRARCDRCCWSLAIRSRSSELHASGSLPESAPAMPRATPACC